MTTNKPFDIPRTQGDERLEEDVQVVLGSGGKTAETLLSLVTRICLLTALANCKYGHAMTGAV